MVLVIAASHAPVPEDGIMKPWAVAVLNTFLRSLRTLVESSGNLDDRWSSIATIMARCTRSGTLVGPGTNRKFRPGMRRPITPSSSAIRFHLSERPRPAAHAATHTKRYRGSMQLDMRLGTPSDEPCQRFERHLRIAMQSELVHLIE